MKANWPDVALAFVVSRDAHERIQQVRKYGGGPYYLHPWEVALRLMNEGASPSVVCAGALHDVKEDVPPPAEGWDVYISKMFGEDVNALVDEMTHEYTTEKYPHMNRAERKKLEAKRISGTSEAARWIKTVDVYHNLMDLAVQDPGFARTMATEVSMYIDSLPDSRSKRLLVLLIEDVLKKEGHE
jgi:(p)ppGpp synthase/HD superfamily hydrolase